MNHRTYQFYFQKCQEIRDPGSVREFIQGCLKHPTYAKEFENASKAYKAFFGHELEISQPGMTSPGTFPMYAAPGGSPPTPGFAPGPGGDRMVPGSYPMGPGFVPGPGGNQMFPGDWIVKDHVINLLTELDNQINFSFNQSVKIIKNLKEHIESQVPNSFIRKKTEPPAEVKSVSTHPPGQSEGHISTSYDITDEELESIHKEMQPGASPPTGSPAAPDQAQGENEGNQPDDSADPDQAQGDEGNQTDGSEEPTPSLLKKMTEEKEKQKGKQKKK